MHLVHFRHVCQRCSVLLESGHQRASPGLRKRWEANSSVLLSFIFFLFKHTFKQFEKISGGCWALCLAGCVQSAR